MRRHAGTSPRRHHPHQAPPNTSHRDYCTILYVAKLRSVKVNRRNCTKTASSERRLARIDEPASVPPGPCARSQGSDEVRSRRLLELGKASRVPEADTSRHQAIRDAPCNALSSMTDTPPFADTPCPRTIGQAFALSRKRSRNHPMIDSTAPTAIITKPPLATT